MIDGALKKSSLFFGFFTLFCVSIFAIELRYNIYFYEKDKRKLIKLIGTTVNSELVETRQLHIYS